MENTVIIQNPPSFLNERYLQRRVLINNFSEGRPTVLYQNEYPHKVFISFPSKQTSADFVSRYNNKLLEENYD